MNRIIAMLSLTLLAATPAMAASYPLKPVEMVVAGAPGGGLDLTGRAMDNALREAKLFNQSFVLKNLGGAGGNIAKTYTHQKKGDSHVIYVESNRVYVNKIVGTTDIDHHDLTPLGRLITEYLVWVVRADSPIKSAQEVLARLKADPSSVVFGVGTVPSNDQMNILRPAMASGVDPKKVQIVSFKAGADLMVQLLGGHVAVISTGLSEAIEQVKGGKARVIAVSSPQPLAGELSKVPTWRSMGVDVSILHWRGLFGPPGIPADTVKYWDSTLGKMVKTEHWKQALDKHGWFDAYADAATFRKSLDEESKVNAQILTDLGMAKGAAKK